MSQYTSLFRSTRVPYEGIDKLKKGDRDVRHIVVMRRGHFYSCPVLDADGKHEPHYIIVIFGFGLFAKNEVFDIFIFDRKYIFSQ